MIGLLFETKEEMEKYREKSNKRTEELKEKMAQDLYNAYKDVGWTIETGRSFVKGFCALAQANLDPED